MLRHERKKRACDAQRRARGDQPPERAPPPPQRAASLAERGPPQRTAARDEERKQETPPAAAAASWRRHPRSNSEDAASSDDTIASSGDDTYPSAGAVRDAPPAYLSPCVSESFQGAFPQDRKSPPQRPGRLVVVGAKSPKGSRQRPSRDGRDGRDKAASSDSDCAAVDKPAESRPPAVLPQLRHTRGNAASGNAASGTTGAAQPQSASPQSPAQATAPRGGGGAFLRRTSSPVVPYPLPQSPAAQAADPPAADPAAAAGAARAGPPRSFSTKNFARPDGAPRASFSRQDSFLGQSFRSSRGGAEWSRPASPTTPKVAAPSRTTHPGSRRAKRLSVKSKAASQVLLDFRALARRVGMAAVVVQRFKKPPGDMDLVNASRDSRDAAHQRHERRTLD
ncbi:hypothetical protein M885DRAFT_590789 [Pelagophyceae sp. CCMP2097]|nr:hypothetical protein M885DRAFT_590789 [Pelagophyceae sp. CCMP2097]